MSDPDRNDEIKATKRGWTAVASIVLGLFALSYVIET